MYFTDDLLLILTSYSKGYKLMRKRMAGYTGSTDFLDLKEKFRVSENTLRVTLSRLRKRGFVEKRYGAWIGTARGKKYIINRIKKLTGDGFFFKNHSQPNKNVHKKQKSIIIVFDIPEIYRKKRDWLRIELAILGFAPLQKSVWFGPAPLPEKLIKDLHDLRLPSYVKFFEAKEHEII